MLERNVVRMVGVIGVIIILGWLIPRIMNMVDGGTRDNQAPTVKPDTKFKNYEDNKRRPMTIVSPLVQEFDIGNHHISLP